MKKTELLYKISALEKRIDTLEDKVLYPYQSQNRLPEDIIKLAEDFGFTKPKQIGDNRYALDLPVISTEISLENINGVVKIKACEYYRDKLPTYPFEEVFDKNLGIEYYIKQICALKGVGVRVDDIKAKLLSTDDTLFKIPDSPQFSKEFITIAVRLGFGHEPGTNAMMIYRYTNMRIFLTPFGKEYFSYAIYKGDAIKFIGQINLISRSPLVLAQDLKRVLLEADDINKTK